jgi:hypothetical protein
MKGRKREPVDFVAGSLTPGSKQLVTVTCALSCSPKCRGRAVTTYTSIIKTHKIRGCYICRCCALTRAGKEQKRNASRALEVEDFVYGTESHGSGKLARATCLSSVSKKCEATWIARHGDIRANCDENGGNFICQPCAMRLKKAGRRNPAAIYDIDENLLRDMDNELKPYLLGWIAGDGNFSKKGQIRISIQVSDRHILEDMRDEICPELPIAMHKEGTMATLIISSVKMNADGRRWLGLSHFTEEGSWKKSYVIQFPHDVPSNEAKWHFLRGYFDADGCISETRGAPTAVFSSGSSSMLEAIRSFVGLPASISGANLTWCGVASLHFLNRLYAGATYKLNRKYQRFLDLQAWRPQQLQARHLRELATQLDSLPLYGNDF